MPFYEVMCIASMSAPHSQLVSILQKCEALISKHGGVLRSIDHLGLRPLSSRMRSHGRYNVMGRYVRLSIQCSPTGLSAMEERLRIEEDIVRYMTIKHQQLAPQVHPRSPVYLSAGQRPSQQNLQESASIEAIRHTTPLDYLVAQTLLRHKLIQKVDVAQLPRYVYDPMWQHNSHRLIQSLQQQLADGNDAATPSTDSASPLAGNVGSKTKTTGPQGKP